MEGDLLWGQKREEPRRTTQLADVILYQKEGKKDWKHKKGISS